MRSAPRSRMASQMKGAPAASPAWGTLRRPASRPALLEAAETQAEQSLGPVREDQLDRLDGGLGPGSGVDVGAPAQPDAVLRLGLNPAPLDALEQRLGGYPAADVVEGSHGDLGVADVLGGAGGAKLASDEREVVRVAELLGDYP